MKKTIRYALMQSFPVFFGYLFLGAAFGVMLSHIGYSPAWAALAAVTIYAGSGQFLLVELLANGSSLFVVAFMTLFINSRHMFYGLSFIERFKKMGKVYPYMIFSLTDETYSVLCSMNWTPAGVDREKAMFFTALFDQLYWIFGCTLGCIMGTVIPFDFNGIEFSMTALFTVIFVEQWKSFPSHIPALLGLGVSMVFLILLGADRFLLPAMMVTVILLILFKKRIVKGEEK